MANTKAIGSSPKALYELETNYHPYIGEIISELNKNSIKGIFDPKFQETLDEEGVRAFNKYQIDDTIVKADGMPRKHLDVSGGPYSIYNWELFFHVPFSIAVHLSKNQRFAEAQKWFHFIFDPSSTEQTESPKRYWKFKKFREEAQPAFIDEIFKALSKEEDSDLKKETAKSIARWRNNPFQPHAIAGTRFLAYQLSVIMKYLDNLIAWGDSLFRQDTMESINEATQLYVMAANMLGEKPQEIPNRGKKKAKTFKDLRNKFDDFSNALTDLELYFPSAMKTSATTDDHQAQFKSFTGIGRTLYFCIPQNDKLLGYWDTVADRLFKIRHCMNIEGMVRQLPLFQPPIDPGMLVKAAAAGIDVSSIVNGQHQPLSPVRSSLLIQKALELCSEVRSLGSNLLSALEKKDAESLSLLRQKQEIRMMELNTEVRFLQWKEAEASTDALLNSRKSVFQRFKHYQRLLGKSEGDYAELENLELERRSLMEGSSREERESSFESIYQEFIGKYSEEIELEEYPDYGYVKDGKLHLNTNEDKELNTMIPWALGLEYSAASLDVLNGGIVHLPDFDIETAYWGIGASSEMSGGEKLSASGNFISQSMKTTANMLRQHGSNMAKTSSYERRAEDWILQRNQAAQELVQIGKQVITSLIREQITKKEHENQLQQLEHSKEIDTFLKDKFTNRDLYKWMQSELSKVYYDCYKFAYDTAKRAEQTMKFELMRPEIEERNFIKFNYWDAGRKGLLSGEALYLDLKRMEMAYHEHNKREYELTKHISLKQLNPMALLQLKATGSCTVDIPEWLYDMDCPGHYMRRIKSVAVSIPAVAGPYTNINCTLSLQKSTLRKSPTLSEGTYERDSQQEDDRFVDYLGTIDSIVTSNAQNDSGMFEVNLNEQRFLPFENAGAVSNWKLELPSGLRQFDYHTITDVILHIRYTSRQGGGQLATKATESLKSGLNTADQSGLTRLFSLKHDFPSEWHKFATSENEPFRAMISKDHFPYFAQLGALNFNTSPFELATLDPETGNIKPVLFSEGDIELNIEDLNGDNREAELRIKASLDKESDVFLLVHYHVNLPD